MKLEDFEGLDIPDSRRVVTESHGESVVQSAINLLEYIGRNYSEAETQKLGKAMFKAIESRNPDKFTRAVRRLKGGV